jgi:hypothetical protein
MRRYGPTVPLTQRYAGPLGDRGRIRTSRRGTSAFAESFSGCARASPRGHLAPDIGPISSTETRVPTGRCGSKFSGKAGRPPGPDRPSRPPGAVKLRGRCRAKIGGGSTYAPAAAVPTLPTDIPSPYLVLSGAGVCGQADRKILAIRRRPPNRRPRDRTPAGTLGTSRRGSSSVASPG